MDTPVIFFTTSPAEEWGMLEKKDLYLLNLYPLLYLQAVTKQMLTCNPVKTIISTWNAVKSYILIWTLFSQPLSRGITRC